MKSRIFISLVLLLVAFTACNEKTFLDSAELGLEQSPDFKSNQDLDNVLVTGYYNMKSSGVFGLSDAPIIYDGVSDLFEYKKFKTVVDTRGNYSISKRDYTNTRIELMEWMWRSGYSMIQSANIVLDYYQNNLPFEDSNKGQVNRMLGEAHFLRAYAYYDLARMFAKPYQSDPKAPNVVLRTIPMFKATDYGMRGTSENVYSLIVADCKQAIELLPDLYDPTKDAVALYARARKDAALFLLARTYFLMGENFWGTENDSYFAGNSTALGAINDLIKSTRYTLVPGASIGTTFTQAGTPFKMTSEVVFQEENIETWRCNRIGWYFTPQFVTNTNRFFRSYGLDSLIIKKIGWDNETNARKDARYKAFYIRYDNDPATLFAQPDPEFSTEYIGTGFNICCKKFIQSKHVPLYRIPEMYLMRAAILVKKNIALDVAKADINLIRARAGSGVELVTSNPTIEDVDIEWIKEMAGEGTRLAFQQAIKSDIGPSKRVGVSSVPYDHRSLYFYFPEAEVERNPLVDNIE